MYKSFTLSLCFLATSHAFAVEPIKLPFTSSASAIFSSLFFPDLDQSTGVNCTANVLRPNNQEDAMASEDNMIVCQTNSDTRTLSFGESVVDSFGTHFDKIPFSLMGPLAEEIFETFRKKTSTLTDEFPIDSMWSMASLCDPNGDICITSYFLNQETTEHSAAQIACSRVSQLLHNSTVTVEPSQFPSHTAYLEGMVDAQVKAGNRKITSLHCAFLP